MNNSNWHLAGERTAQGEEGRDVGGPRPAERLPGDRGGEPDPGGAPLHTGFPIGPTQDVRGGEDAGRRWPGGAMGRVAEGGGGEAGG